MAKVWFLACVGAIALFAHSFATAAERGRRVVVVVEGTGANDVATAIAAHVDATNRVVPNADFKAALAKHGFKALAPAVTNPKRATQLVTQARASAQETNADVVILAFVVKTKRGVVVRIWAIDMAKDGATVDKSAPLPVTATAQSEADAVWDSVSDLVPPVPEAPPPASSAAPPPPPPVASTEPEHDAPSPGAHTRGGSVLVVQLAMEGALRSFSYTDRITTSLRSYDLKAPMGAVRAEVYPFARTTLPFLRGFGITGDFSRAFAISSADSSGTRVGTSWQSFDVGARERLNLGSRFILGVNVGYGALDFKFDQPPFTATLPSVAYRFLRAGADFRVAFGSFSVFGGGAYLPILSAGPIGDAFPHEKVGGVEAGLGVAYMLTTGLELSLGVRYARFFYSMKPVPGDANVAGGALDQLGNVSLGIGYLL